MAKTPLKVCAFCGQTAGGELGGLRNTSDKSILAHYNCLIFSPLVFTTDDEDDPQFVLSSVRAEIKRGKSLKCSYCKQHGATIGCEVKRCQKTYHYDCVEKDKGTTDDENYRAYCSKHVQEAKTDSDSPEETERSKTPDQPSTEKEMPKCSYCKRKGATIGCVIETCRKAYHLLCVEKDEGVLDVVGDDQHVAYCFKHAEKDQTSPEESERSGTPDSLSTSYANTEKTRKSTPGNFSSPRTKKNAQQDEEWPGSERPSKSGTRLGKRSRASTPRNFSSPRAKKTAIQDTDSSGSSERPSTPGTRSSWTRNRSSDLGDYSPPHANKKRSPAKEVEMSRSSSSSSASEETPARKMKRKSSPRQIFKQNTKRTRTNNLEDQQTDTNDASNEANLETTKSASPVKPKARRGRPRSKKGKEAASTQKKSKTFASVDSEDTQKSGAEGEEMNAQTSGEEIEGVDAEVESHEKRSTRLSQAINDTCIPSTSQAPFDDQQTDTNDTSNEANLETTNSASPVKPKSRRGRLPSKKGKEAASTQKKSKTFASVDSEDTQKSGAEGEEMNAQTSGEEIEGVDAEVESHEKRSTRLSQAINDTCIPSTSQAPFDVNELHFTKLYESQCKIANSIESGVSEFRNFAQQFQTLFKQFLDICQSLNHGICSNNTNAHGQTTSAEVHHRPDTSPDLLPLSHANSHGPSCIIDSANDADTNIDMLSSNTPTNDAKEPSKKTNGSATDDDPNIVPLSSENTPTKGAKEPSRDANDSANNADPNIVTLSSEITPTNGAKKPSRKTKDRANDADVIIDTLSAENTPRKTRSSLPGRSKRH